LTAVIRATLASTEASERKMFCKASTCSSVIFSAMALRTAQEGRTVGFEAVVWSFWVVASIGGSGGPVLCAHSIMYKTHVSASVKRMWTRFAPSQEGKLYVEANAF